MFFYICHQINHYILRSSDANGSKNVRTLIMGGILYILLHAYLFSESNHLYKYRYYFYYLLILDAFVIGVIYKLYYGESIVNELSNDKKKTEKIEEDKINEDTLTILDDKSENKSENKSEKENDKLMKNDKLDIKLKDDKSTKDDKLIKNNKLENKSKDSKSTKDNKSAKKSKIEKSYDSTYDSA